jgi:hypothetical protein
MGRMAQSMRYCMYRITTNRMIDANKRDGRNQVGKEQS